MTSIPAPSVAARSPGRPREFDMDAALDAAIRVFRERGYHAASIADLSAAMGLTAGSIYKAFADKRAVFLAAFARYTALRHAQMRAVLAQEPTGLGQVRALLRFYVMSSTGAEGAAGCLVAGSATALSTFDDEMAQAVDQAVRDLGRMIETAIRAGQADGSIPATVEAGACALGLLCLVQGFRIVGKLGYGEHALQSAADAMLLGLS
ncbi:TetR/AcrR family transcriptional regulator [Telluria mixta]|uniref:TetR/AcrR family transcriptional regulator n=1 Tax=Telluria mixta TaxID=34071 RepID=A0ABT2C640_9BURK|nr:TetR/AcrR family transcriptional regulator [Telluria mixta]MCS0632627.1 TetR/AcrR family transcriptional regulator [Telluria mixta]WEM99081.1 TetR/AcrR family transcriptional regulator [Telluria mixta]